MIIVRWKHVFEADFCLVNQRFILVFVCFTFYQFIRSILFQDSKLETAYKCPFFIAVPDEELQVRRS